MVSEQKVIASMKHCEKCISAGNFKDTLFCACKCAWAKDHPMDLNFVDGYSQAKVSPSDDEDQCW